MDEGRTEMTARNAAMSASLRTIVLVCVVGALWLPSLARAQSNQFGGQDRADAAARMIVLGVQQGISSLPPTSGQSFTYEFDPQLATNVTSERLGSTSFRTPQTIGTNKFSLRFAASYFELADSFAPIPYAVNDQTGTPFGVAALGLRANAHVGLLNFGGNYGFSNRFEMMMNVPVVIVDAHATQSFSTSTSGGPPRQANLSGTGVTNGDVGKAVADLNTLLRTPGSGLTLRSETFRDLGFSFNDGTHSKSAASSVGIGRISLGVKGVLYADERLQIAVSPEFFLPSPNEDEFAGSGSAAILPRLIGAFKAADFLRLHLDAGYDFDFDTDELRRFVWNTGVSVPLPRVTFDIGVGGSKFNQGIKWTPSSAPFVDAGGNKRTISALGNNGIGRPDNRLGSNFIDALGGIKVRVAESTVISGAVNVPLNNEGFRAAAVGTLAVEQYF
jgi:hypothetical protein